MEMRLSPNSPGGGLSIRNDRDGLEKIEMSRRETLRVLVRIPEPPEARRQNLQGGLRVDFLQLP